MICRKDRWAGCLTHVNPKLCTKCSLMSQAQDARNHGHEALELMLILQIIMWDDTLTYLHK
jgi:hypothetical protein